MAPGNDLVALTVTLILKIAILDILSGGGGISVSQAHIFEQGCNVKSLLCESCLAC